VNAWVYAPDSDKAARFAVGEAVRWLEWGMRSYENFALGLAVLLFAIAVRRTARIPRGIAYFMGLSAVTYVVQGWVAGTDGFSPTQTLTIVLAELLNAVWMTWLLVVAWRTRDSEAPDRHQETAGAEARRRSSRVTIKVSAESGIRQGPVDRSVLRRDPGLT
jgi:hypothetical protein